MKIEFYLHQVWLALICVLMFAGLLLPIGQLSNVEGASATDSSVMSYLKKYNATEAATLQTKLTAALEALKACQDSGKSFVEAPGATSVKAAMDAISELDNELNEAADWILKH